MATVLEFNTFDEFKSCLENKEWKILMYIVPTLLDAYKTSTEYVHALEIYIKDIYEPYWIDITFVTKDIPFVLSNCLDSCIQYEKYEWCFEIKKILDSNDTRNFSHTRTMSGSFIPL